LPDARPALDALPRVEIASAAELRDWLAANHGGAGSVWVVTWKKGCGRHHVPWGAVVDEALCFGWIDSLPRKLDADRAMLLLSPRKPGSGWSKVNKDKVARLTAEGRMAPSGLAKVEAAQADGSWARLDAVDAMEEPHDLSVALDAVPVARANFDAFPPSSRRGILEWIANAKRPGTRAARIADTVARAAENRKANHPAGRDAGPRRPPLTP
jgi:uncharacterized protein YdeI (YjbR/CyaY-like superfamily)